MYIHLDLSESDGKLTTIDPRLHVTVGNGYPVAKHLSVATPPSLWTTSSSSRGFSTRAGACSPSCSGRFVGATVVDG